MWQGWEHTLTIVYTVVRASSSGTFHFSRWSCSCHPCLNSANSLHYTQRSPLKTSTLLLQMFPVTMSNTSWWILHPTTLFYVHTLQRIQKIILNELDFSFFGKILHSSEVLVMLIKTTRSSFKLQYDKCDTFPKWHACVNTQRGFSSEEAEGKTKWSTDVQRSQC